MKCPKCGYISFDYNQVCPKCNRDITGEREKMNLPSFKPNPPSLPTGLTGEPNEPSMGLDIQGQEETAVLEQEMGITPEDSQAIKAMEEAFNDSQELEIQLEPAAKEETEESPESVDLSGLTPQIEEKEIQKEKPSKDWSLDDADEDLSLALEELALEDTETDTLEAEGKTEEEIALKPDLSLSEDADIESTAVFETLEKQKGIDSFDLDDLSPDESGKAFEKEKHEEKDDEVSLELEELASGLEESTEDLESSGRGEQGKDVFPSVETQGDSEDFSIDLESLEGDLELEDEDNKGS
jgi:hypothetical protein